MNRSKIFTIALVLLSSLGKLRELYLTTVDASGFTKE